MTQKTPKDANLLTHYEDATAYQTKDGSEIRELMHPSIHGSQLQSLAEARLQPGQITQAHRHKRTEELYYILQGQGEMHLEGDRFEVRAGDCVCIPPGHIHFIQNSGTSELVFLCCCSPAYAHDDTELIET